MLGDRRRQRRLAVIDVTDRAHIHMRLRSLKLLLRHLFVLPWFWNSKHSELAK
jgi:hypothetical protein